MKKKIHIIGVPSDLGANIRGAALGPHSIRIAGLQEKLKALKYKAKDLGDIFVPTRETLSRASEESRFLKEIRAICHTLGQKTFASIEKDCMPLTIGGDHSIAIGSISGVSTALARRGEKLGVIWIDAHADINTPETSPSMNIHGMPVAVLLGLGHPELTQLLTKEPKISAKNTCLIGIRDIDESEKAVCRETGVNVYTMKDIDKRGMHAVMAEAIKKALDGTAGIHLSVDLDGIDPLVAPGVSTPVEGGLSFREAHLGLEMVAETGRMLAIDLVEVNPIYDVSNKTARLAVGLLCSALGKSIL